MKIRWEKILLYVSLIFLIIALYRANYLVIPTVYSISNLILAILFLFLAFILQTFSWHSVINQAQKTTSYSESIASIGMYIFTKYIPGKVLMVLGRASYISSIKNYPLSELSSLSLNAQFISLWTGFSLGTIGLFLIGEIQIWKWPVLLLWVSLSCIIFSTKFSQLLELIILKVLKKQISLPQLKLNELIRVLPWFLANWLSWCIGFYFLVTSLSSVATPLTIGLGFAFSATLGILAVISPGGLGVREGIMVGYLTFSGIPPTTATTIAVASRLWFLIGEIFIFIVGLIADRKVKKDLAQKAQTTNDQPLANPSDD